MEDGYIRLHRAIRRHWVYDDPWKLWAWTTILMQASWKPRKVAIGTTIVDVKRGEFVASQRYLAKLLQCGREKAENLVRMLETDHMTSQRIENGNRVIAITNYDRYQSDQPDDQPLTNQGPTTYQPRTNHGPTKEKKVQERTKKEEEGTTQEAPPKSPQGEAGALEGTPTPDEWVTKWNRYARSNPPLKQVRSLTKERRRKLQARLRSPGWWDTCQLGVNILPLPEKDESNWQPGIDWLTANDTNAVRLAEGEFDWRWGDDSKLVKLRRKQAAQASEDREAQEKAKRKQRYQQLQADQEHRNELGKVFQAIAESDGS